MNTVELFGFKKQLKFKIIKANKDSYRILKQNTKEKMPFFSVILPTYNREKLLRKAIDSVLKQTFTNFELIIINDGSTDNTENIVFDYTDKRIAYIKNDTNLERCLSRNKGIKQAKGKYICFLDSDDYHLHNHLEKLHSFIKKNDEPEAFFFTNSWNETSNGIRTERLCPNYNEYDSFVYFLRYTVNPQRWAVHRSIINKHLFDPKITICEDMDTSLRIAAAGVPIYQLNERTTVYVAAEDSFTVSDTFKAEKELHYFKKIFNRPELKNKLPKIEKNRLLSMCYYFISIKKGMENKKLPFYKNALLSVYLYPKGYNGKTNKTLFVMGLYLLPLLGPILKTINSLFKNE